MRIVINYALFCRLLQQVLNIINCSDVYILNLLNNIIKEKVIFLKLSMTSNKFCLNCGSSDVVSDRSLGGKMVCFKCGSSSFRKKSFSPLINKKFIYIVIALIILFLVII
tara:strand:+ start:71 stop:400 length:330 start_codon:yes stop_codon:yes gene_type:complete